MAKVVLDIDLQPNGKLTRDSVLVFNGEKWVAVSKSAFLSEIFVKSNENAQNHANLVERFNTLVEKYTELETKQDELRLIFENAIKELIGNE